ncbi:unnamed protein product [Bursaphelenchus xylophilus]|uniref:(pine wood nematode) hypothetical protein n=1 Tax=Bursaphelenchus xylophilus TaxID=6326 RepID=A0A1I7RLJ2_BURXY|nr:unnamed protein product [Bursaphelenchus xylophilus]CAG9082926.1 unnamed protein product [Bursaphelenchus xylophilus]
MAVFPLFRLIQIFVLLTLLFAVLFVAPICTPLVPFESCSNTTNTSVVKPLDVLPKTENSSSASLEDETKFVKQQRSCLQISHSDIFVVPTFHSENPKDTVTLFFLLLFVGVLCMFIATILMMQIEKKIDYKAECMLRFILIILSLADFCMVFICSYMIYIWPNLWTSHYSAVPQIPINFYVIHILVLANFVLGFVNSFVYGPRVELVKMENFKGGKKSYQVARRYEALQN